MRLYGSDTSPYVRKARVLILEKGIDCQCVLERPSDPGGRFRDLNPLGKVPVLELDNGQVLFDSPVIVEYLDTLSGDPLIPETGGMRWEVKKVHALADGIMDAVVIRMLELRRRPEKQNSEVVSAQEKKIAHAMRHADTLTILVNHPVAGKYTVADIALAVALEYVDFRYPHEWRTQWTHLAKWLESISARPAFQETRPPEE